MAVAHAPLTYDPAVDSAHAAWAAVAVAKDAARAAWATISASQQATYVSIGLAAVSITVAVLAILNTSRLQENARKQHLSAAAIGVAHALMIYLGIIELLKKHPPDQRPRGEDLRAFWDEIEAAVPDLPRAIGIYVFSTCHGGNYTPWYVGKTNAKTGFRGEIFQDHKLSHYVSASQRKKG